MQREDTSTNVTYGDWPVPGASDVTLRLGDADGEQPGVLTTSPRRSPHLEQGFVDNGRDRHACTVSCGNMDSADPEEASFLVAQPDAGDPNRLVYLSDVLTEQAHLSGTPQVRLRVAVDNASAANLTAYLMDYGPPGSTEYTMVTRGWMDVQNRLRRDRTTPIKQGHFYDFAFELHPDDYVFQPGHRIGLVVLSTDWEFTLRPDPGTQLSLKPSFSSLTLPLVGGRDAL